MLRLRCDSVSRGWALAALSLEMHSPCSVSHPTLSQPRCMDVWPSKANVTGIFTGDDWAVRIVSQSNPLPVLRLTLLKLTTQILGRNCSLSTPEPTISATLWRIKLQRWQQSRSRVTSHCARCISGCQRPHGYYFLTRHSSHIYFFTIKPRLGRSSQGKIIKWGENLGRYRVSQMAAAARGWFILFFMLSKVHRDLVERDTGFWFKYIKVHFDFHRERGAIHSCLCFRCCLWFTVRQPHTLAHAQRHRMCLFRTLSAFSPP